ncbi:MAG: glyoxalase [Acidobacteria bacterium]|nr:MAG: glyoxalase [Acidobacteriota bacterium]REJ98409.1 MAG: glyoxalase [Acidobacteriota bacterium]REK17155.1 MAG: glyoxalase [Acidobacteriota bacterium]REK43065.1 MAG: glyoxalase [Acidobacteriota bacterium]
MRYQGLPIGWFLIGLSLIAVFLSSAFGQPVSRVESVGFTVSDLERAEKFYTSVLGFKKVSEKELWGREVELLTGVFGARVNVARFRLGDEILELTEYLTHQGRPIPADSRSNDRWFQHVAIIVRDMDEAYAVLRKNKVRHASTGPQTLPKTIPNAAGIKAFYFKDPDGHVLEILEFPPDKGDPKWRERSASGDLFLGVDHTAIVVEDTDKSLGFYRDTLGLSVAGESMNFGTEQEHLNNVFGARLRITGLRTGEPGVAVEFLEYEAPTDGRPFPSDTRSSDLWHWQTSFEIQEFGSISMRLRRAGSIAVSSGTIDLRGTGYDFGSALIVRDPDGHAVRIASK